MLRLENQWWNLGLDEAWLTWLSLGGRRLSRAHSEHNAYAVGCCMFRIHLGVCCAIWNGLVKKNRKNVEMMILKSELADRCGPVKVLALVQVAILHDKLMSRVEQVSIQMKKKLFLEGIHGIYASKTVAACQLSLFP